MPSDIDKREHPRKPFLAEAALEFASGKYQSRISELSLGGCYVDSIASVKQGEQISLTITFGSGVSERFTGEVAYVIQGMGFGIRFVDITMEQKILLLQIVD